MVELTDVVFALDSIPAIFAVTRDAFVVFSSNALAILGLRSLYFVLAGAVGRFRYLRPALAALLAFVAIKMLISSWIKIPIPLSLAAIVAILGAGALASWVRVRKDQFVRKGDNSGEL
jgi:tellurite resistance protein TerC